MAQFHLLSSYQSSKGAVVIQEATFAWVSKSDKIGKCIVLRVDMFKFMVDFLEKHPERSLHTQPKFWDIPALQRNDQVNSMELKIFEKSGYEILFRFSCN